MAVMELEKLGPDAAPAIPGLIRALASRNPLTRPYSGGALTCADAVPGAARKLLVKIGAPAIPALTKATENDDPLVRVHAAWALWCLTRQSEKILPVLLQAWKDKNYFVSDECIRDSATEALGEIGQAKPDRVVPILLEFLLDEDEEIVYAAMRGLTLIGPQENIMKTLVALLRDQRQGVRTYAGWQLRELGSAVVPVLVKALGDKDPELRSRVAWTLLGWDERSSSRKSHGCSANRYQGQ
jgi:HEAT repeat protein